MKITETSIEKKINDNTPSCVYGLSKNIEKYGSKFFNLFLNFRGESIHKGLDKFGNNIEHKSCIPDFILLNKKDKEVIDRLCNSFDRGEISDYTLSDYFSSRKNLYFIEAFGDYWHDQKITGISNKELENEVIHAYESLGHHVLVLWEHDIVNNWAEKCLPMINNFIEQFREEGNMLPDSNPSEIRSVLNDKTIKMMHDVDYRKSVNEHEINESVDEIVNLYKGLKNVNVNKYEANLDFFKMREWFFSLVNDTSKRLTRFGQTFLFGVLKNYKRMISNSSGVNLECAFYDEKSLRSIVVDIMKSSDDINIVSIIYAMIEKYGMTINVPFYIPEILFRLHDRMNMNKEMLFDPMCNCGESIIVAYLLGFKRFVGFTDDINKKEDFDRIINWLEYKNAEIVISENGNVDNAKRHIDKDCFVFSCSNNKNASQIISQIMKECEVSVSVLCSKNDFVGSTCAGIMTCKIDYWKRDIPTGYKFYNFLKSDEYKYVKCEECGLYFTSLRGHLQDAHGISAEQYRSLHPNCRITSENESDKISSANRIKYSGIENHHYNKRFVYLMPDGTYASKSDKYKRAWGVDEVKKEHIIDASTIDYVPDYAKSITGVEGEDYVVCAICGVHKGSLTQHIRKCHDMGVDEYKEKYGCPVHSRKNAEAFHNCAMSKWKTQFENGTSRHAVKKPSCDKKKPGIDLRKLESMLERGCNQPDLCREFGYSDTTIRKFMVDNGIPMPSRTELAIRRAVHSGAELDIREFSRDEVRAMVAKDGKVPTAKRFGLNRTVFDTWMGGDS